MANYYCKYCGGKYGSVTQLCGASCKNHPSGVNKGKHSLYEGGEKSQYTCKFCGSKYSTLIQMTGASCRNHPNGTNKGKHEPAL